MSDIPLSLSGPNPRRVAGQDACVEGAAKSWSDLDLAIDAYAALQEDFAESDLPFGIDVVDLARAAPDFRLATEPRRVTIERAPGGRVDRLRGKAPETPTSNR